MSLIAIIQTALLRRKDKTERDLKGKEPLVNGRTVFYDPMLPLIDQPHTHLGMGGMKKDETPKQ